MRLVQTIQQHIEEYFIIGSLVLLIGASVQKLSLPINGLGVSPALIIAVLIVAVLFDRWRLRKR